MEPPLSAPHARQGCYRRRHRCWGTVGATTHAHARPAAALGAQHVRQAHEALLVSQAGEGTAPRALERPVAAPAGSSGPAHKPGRGRRPGMTSWQVGALLQWFSGSSGGTPPPLPAATGAEQTPALLTAPSPSLVRRGRLPGLPSPLLRRQVPRSPPLLALVQRAACRPCRSAHHVDVEAAASAH